MRNTAICSGSDDTVSKEKKGYVTQKITNRKGYIPLEDGAALRDNVTQ